MNVRFEKAVRRQRKLRLAAIGPKGAGKTKLALTIAGVMGKRIALIDANRGAASFLVGEPGIPDFETVVLESFHPRSYIQAIRAAERQGFDFIVVDDASQAWAGKDGALELVDKAPKRWRDVTPHHNALVECLAECSAHLVVTLRSKSEYVLEEQDGARVVRRYGLAPVQQAGFEAEFDVIGELDVDHVLRITASRCSLLDREVFSEPDAELGERLLAWLREGEPARERPRDEYGLLIPRGRCPIVPAGRKHGGKNWTQISPKEFEQLVEQYRPRMKADREDWADYLLARNRARLEALARIAEKARDLAQTKAGAEAPAESKGDVNEGTEAAQ